MDGPLSSSSFDLGKKGSLIDYFVGERSRYLLFSLCLLIILAKAIETGILLYIRPSGSYNYREINKGLWFWHISYSYQFTRPFHEFELLSGAEHYGKVQVL